MLISEMEAVLKSLDQRVGRIEQILPTLATRAELRDEIRGVRVLIEDVRGDVKVVHDRIDIEMAGLNRRMDERFDAMQAQFGGLQTLFDAMQMQLAEVLRRLPPP
jgi:hypothetical protein